MELVECKKEYWEFVRCIRIHPRNQQYFLTQADITPDQQIRFMNQNAKNYRICLKDGIPVGYIGIIKDDEITYCTDPNYQGKGVGTFMVSEFIKLHDKLTAYVLPENIGSNRVFEKLGFQKQIFYTKSK